MSGYVKLWRSIEQNELLDNDNNALVVFVKIITKANRLTGTLTTGRNKFAAACNMKPSTLYDVLQRLQKATIIRLESNKYATTIYICNWWKYQQDDGNKPTARVAGNGTIQEKKKKELDTNVSMEKNELFNELSETLGHTRPPILTAGRKDKLALRLKKFKPDDLKRAAEAIASNPFMMGENDRHKRYGTIDYLLRSDEKVDEWLDQAVESAPKNIDLTKVEIPDVV